MIRRIRLWWRLRELFPVSFWRLIVSVNIEQVRDEFETWIRLQGESDTARRAADAAEVELAGVTGAEEAAVAVRRAEADQAIAQAQATYATASQTADNLTDLARRQSVYIAALLGVVPPVPDPTPEQPSSSEE